MFTFTSTIFFMLIDIICSAFLIGVAIIALAIAIFVVTAFIKAMFSLKKNNTMDDK